MGKTGHTSAPRGKRVRLKLKDGRVIFGKFMAKEHGWVTLDVDGDICRYWMGECIGLTIWKQSFNIKQHAI